MAQVHRMALQGISAIHTQCNVLHLSILSAALILSTTTCAGGPGSSHACPNHHRIQSSRQHAPPTHIVAVLRGLKRRDERRGEEDKGSSCDGAFDGAARWKKQASYDATCKSRVSPRVMGLRGGGGGGGGGGSSSGGNPDDGCWYGVLGVQPSASPDAIKAAYKQEALKWHPDKNAGSSESEARFKKVSHAYEVLSDPHERAWYDANREQIMWRGRRGSGSSSWQEHAEESPEQEKTGLDLLRYFSSSAYSGMHDGDGGFYAVYRQVFSDIQQLEADASQKAGVQKSRAMLPSFGHRQNCTRRLVNEFYSTWEDFVSIRGFEGSIMWNLGAAENRFERRRMDEENKRAQAKERRLFSEQVRELVRYVKRRDARLADLQLQEERQRSAELQRETAMKAAAPPPQARENSPPDHPPPAPVKDEVHEAELERLLRQSKADEDARRESRRTAKEAKELIKAQKAEGRKPKEHADAVPERSDAASLTDDEVAAVNQRDTGASQNAAPALPPVESAAEVTNEGGLDGIGELKDALGGEEDASSPDGDEGGGQLDSAEGIREGKSVKKQIGMAKLKRMKRALKLAAMESAGPVLVSEGARVASRASVQPADLEQVRFRRSAATNMDSSPGCLVCQEKFASRNKLFDHIKQNPSHAVYVDGEVDGMKKKGASLVAAVLTGKQRKSLRQSRRAKVG